MALSEQEEFELLSLEREKSRAGSVTSSKPFIPSGSKPQMGAMDVLKDFGGLMRDKAHLAIPLPMRILDATVKEGGKQLDKAAYNAGGAVTDFTGSPEAGFATNVAVQAVPTVLGGMATSAAAAPKFEALAQRLMQSAIKPSRYDQRTGAAAKAIGTMLDEGINVSAGGMQKLRAEIDRLNEAIKVKLADHPGTIAPRDVVKTLDELTVRFKNQVNPQSDVAAIRKAADEFLNHPALTEIGELTVPVAQAMKQGTYRALGNKSYGELKGAEIEAQKALARGLKDEIAQAAPGIAGLNAAESRLLNALKVVEPRVQMSANKNPVGLGLLTAEPEHLGRLALWMADRSPLMTSLAARAANAGSRAVPFAAGAGAAGAGMSTTGQMTLADIIRMASQQ